MCNDDGTTADHDRGLSFDLDTLRQHRERRHVLGLLGASAAAAGGAVLLGGSATDASALTGSEAGTVSSRASCSATEITAETAGPYPGDGSNGPDILDETGVVRRDIRSSFAGAYGTAHGVPFWVVLTLRNTATCRPAPGLAVYAWHCDAAGRYSMYSEGIEDQNYLRGVQISGAKGRVKFRSIYPACYSGRWPHVHFEVYRNRRAATHGGTILATSQIALPRAPSMAVYRGSSRYAGSETNLNRISLRSDNVFGDDGGARQLAHVTGTVASGYVAKLVVPIDL